MTLQSQFIDKAAVIFYSAISQSYQLMSFTPRKPSFSAIDNRSYVKCITHKTRKILNRKIISRWKRLKTVHWQPVITWPEQIATFQSNRNK
jgi:hypothetical protein